MRICVESAIARLVRIGLIGSGAWSVVGVEAAVYGGVGGAWWVARGEWCSTGGGLPKELLTTFMTVSMQFSGQKCHKGSH